MKRNICLIWRSKYNEEKNVEVIKTANFCKKNNIKFYLANNFKLAIKLDLDGVYISAFNNSLRHNNYLLKKKFKILGSAHNQFEINCKKNQRIKELFISPIFKKKNRSPLGLFKVQNLIQLFKGPKIALGGVNKTNIKLLKLTKFRGFAAIKYFE
tara:strand:+ start:81 stop:545 length:465 start_codon:yes stop_codon:yes gene_type:complete